MFFAFNCDPLNLYILKTKLRTFLGFSRVTQSKFESQGVYEY